MTDGILVTSDDAEWEEETLDGAWNYFECYRDEQRICPLNIALSTLQCPNCNSNMFSFVEDHAHGDTICVSCGLVVDAQYFPEQSHINRAISLPYNRSFYLNELLAIFTMREPKIPDDLFLCINLEYCHGCTEGLYPNNASQLTRSDVKQICRSVVVPTDLQIKYKSTRKHCRYLTSLNKYAERYIQIISRLSCANIVAPTSDFVIQARIYFHCLQVPFMTLIYDKPPPYGRHNWPNYNLALVIACEKFGYEKYKKWFMPKGKNRDKLSHYCDIYFMMFRYLHWAPTPTILNYTSFAYSAPSISSGNSLVLQNRL